MKLPTWFALVLLFIVTAMVTVIARMPLSVALLASGAPIEAESVTGTVWNGEIKNGWVGGYPLGKVEISAEFLPFLTLKAGAHIRIDGPLLRGSTNVRVGRDSLHAHGGTLRTQLEPLGIENAFGEEFSGRVDMTIDELRLARGKGCVEANIAVATDVLQRAVQELGATGFMLEGRAACENGALILPLTGEGDEGTAALNVRVSEAGYMNELVLVPKSVDLGEALVDFGFQQSGNRYSLIQRGDLK